MLNKWHLYLAALNAMLTVAEAGARAGLIHISAGSQDGLVYVLTIAAAGLAVLLSAGTYAAVKAVK